MGKYYDIYRVYQKNPLSGIEAEVIGGAKECIQYRSKDVKINVYDDGTVENPEFSYWSTDDVLRYLETNHENMYKIVSLTVETFDRMKISAAESSYEDGTKAYRSKIIAAHLEHMAEDEFYLTRLKGDLENTINIDKPELNLLKAYYDGNIASALTFEQRDEIYRSEWAFHVCEDIKEWLANYSNMPAEEWPTEKQIQYAAHLYAYDAKYDCTQDYWENIEGVVKMALESCEP